MWVDAHLHLDAPAFDADREAVIARAVAAGVSRMISAGTSIEGSRRVIALTERYPNVWAAVGIHPEAAEGATSVGLESLAALARHRRVCAIGEVGLDYYRERTPRDTQIKAFCAQIRLAQQSGLPLVVHDREAHEDVERILQDEGATRVILHCFSGSPEMALRCADAGWMISLAGPLTFAKPGPLQEVARRIPIDRVLVESDAPYLAPVPLRGRRCEPAFVVHTARKLAALRSLTSEALEACVMENARRMFSRHDELNGFGAGE